MAGIGETEDQRHKARRFLEVNHGRFTYDEALRLLEHHQWDINAANNFVWNEEDSNRIREIAGGGTDWTRVKGDAVLRSLAQEGKIQSEDRQFGCGPCDFMWWRNVPRRKAVSKCSRCRVKYRAVPRDQEWGWAEFRCGYCLHVFRGHGQMQTASPCYRCRNICYPDFVIPPYRRHRGGRGGGGEGRGRRNTNTHSCCAENCFNRSPGSVTPGVMCCHPRSLDRKVLHPSIPHRSTGSTVATFLPQDHLQEFDFDEPELEVIYER